MTGVSVVGAKKPSGARTGSSAFEGLRERRGLACTLLLSTLAVGGAAVDGGCLVTDPVPYEPAENIPPIILPGVTPDPSKLVVSNAGATENILMRLTVPILEYNLDDTLYYSLVWQNCGGIENLLGRYSSAPAPERSRTREFTQTVTLSTARLGREVSCGRVLLAVSDRGWSADMPPLCSPPQDAEGKDVTVVPIVQWWVMKDDGSTADGPGVKTCGETTLLAQE
jgi:hypothetical protein